MSELTPPGIFNPHRFTVLLNYIYAAPSDDNRQLLSCLLRGDAARIGEYLDCDPRYNQVYADMGKSLLADANNSRERQELLQALDVTESELQEQKEIEAQRVKKASAQVEQESLGIGF